MDVNAAVAREGGRGREIVMYVLWGGMLGESGDRKVTYQGAPRKCMVVKEGIGVEELMKMVRKMTGSDISEEKLCTYDREMLVGIEGDSDVKVIFKGNDEHGYMYVARNSSSERAVVCEGRVRDFREGKQIARSGRKYDDVVEVGVEGGNNQVGVKRNYRSLGSEGGELPVSKL
ncbi:LOW QUALITY PROTEIN: hypothetical protein Cgig2_009107 [Carnegiea gigantea]|uniref:Uncharacterized protein n=1 Tax=Carnegiea gigantea TaxID=171969 RepID=A0A9Q1K2Y9_9CARY|nr:LOW QUALITY PROTEIN: hypothetical protein Cgig2_009107 [Carnegiea gigantea]